MDSDSHVCKPALISSARYFGCELLGELRIGADGRSLASEVRVTESGVNAILAVKFFTIRKAKSHLANGEWAAEALNQLLSKPQILDRVEWQEGPQIWRAELISKPVSDRCSELPVLKTSPALSDRWLAELKQTLEVLQTVETDRHAVRSDLVTKRIHQQFPNMPGILDRYSIELWTTAHGNLHWRNLTAPKLMLLDWESWGRAPIGFDVATLYCHSGLIPEVAYRIRRTFAEHFQSRFHLTTTLYVCAEIKKRSQSNSEYAAIEPWIDTVAFECRSGLSVLG